MFKISGNFQVPTIDIAKYKQALREAALTALVDAASRWLSTATAIIPVWSGASHATFLQLAQAAKYTLNINPVTNGREAWGVASSEGGLSSEKDDTYFRFFYKTSLPHLIYNEYNNANISPDPSLFGKLRRPGPYQFQSKANVVAAPALKDFKPPDIRKYIKITRIAS